MVQRGEIYLSDLSGYLGCEQSGTRPVLVVQNDTGNANSPTTMIVPLTSKHKPRLPTHIQLNPKDCGLTRRSTALCEQMRVIDKTRLMKRLGKVMNLDKLEEINHRLKISIGVADTKEDKWKH